MKSSDVPKSSSAAVEVDDMTSRVSPMRSDFHFYAEEHKKDIFNSIDSENLDPLDAITLLNRRILEMWEKSGPSTRNEYMMKEELDRSRFMNEDEIESRHCATLTSRPKPYIHLKPEVVSKVVTKDEEDEEQEKTSGTKRTGTKEEEPVTREENYESPTKKCKESSEPDDASTKKKIESEKEDIAVPKTEGSSEKKAEAIAES